MTEKEYAETKSRIRELDKDIASKKAQVRKLQNECIEYKQQKLSCLVGKAFTFANTDGTIGGAFIVTGVPKPKYNMIGNCNFNEYQIPAVVVSTALHDDETEVYGKNDTVFSTAVNSEDVYVAFTSDRYTEISINEFYEVALRMIRDRVERIK